MKAYIFFFKWEWLHIRVLLFHSWFHSRPQVRCLRTGVVRAPHGSDSASFPLPDGAEHAEHPGPSQGAAGSQSGPVLPAKKGCSASYHSQ